MMRRAWEALVLFCKEMVFALCVAVDRDDDLPFDDEIVDGVGPVNLPPGFSFTMAGDLAEYHELIRAAEYLVQQEERLGEARRDWALIIVGTKLGDIRVAERAVRHCELLKNAAIDRFHDAREAARRAMAGAR